MAGRIVIGTSSRADPGFVEGWYPPDLPARDLRAWYAEVRVMLNNNRGSDAPDPAARLSELLGQDRSATR